MTHGSGPEQPANQESLTVWQDSREETSRRGQKDSVMASHTESSQVRSAYSRSIEHHTMILLWELSQILSQKQDYNEN